jgi:hypothetical protein
MERSKGTQRRGWPATREERAGKEDDARQRAGGGEREGTDRAFAAPSFPIPSEVFHDKLCMLSPPEKLEAPVSFDQFEFHPCNMYFMVGRRFGNHNALVCSAV